MMEQSHVPGLISALRNNARMSQETAEKIEKIVAEQVVQPLLEAQQKSLTEMFLKREKVVLDELEQLKNESLADMIRRISREEIEESIRDNLTVENEYDEYSNDSRPHLKWNGEEF